MCPQFDVTLRIFWRVFLFGGDQNDNPWPRVGCSLILDKCGHKFNNKTFTGDVSTILRAAHPLPLQPSVGTKPRSSESIYIIQASYRCLKFISNSEKLKFIYLPAKLISDLVSNQRSPLTIFLNLCNTA